MNWFLIPDQYFPWSDWSPLPLVLPHFHSYLLATGSLGLVFPWAFSALGWTKILLSSLPVPSPPKVCLPWCLSAAPFPFLIASLKLGDQSWTEHRTIFQVWPDKCQMGWNDHIPWSLWQFSCWCNQDAVSSLAWEGVFLVMFIVQKNPKLKPNSQQEWPLAFSYPTKCLQACLWRHNISLVMKKSNLSL